MFQVLLFTVFIVATHSYAVDFEVKEIPELSDNFVIIEDFNDKGQVCGNTTESNPRGFIWENGNFTYVGSLGNQLNRSYMLALNNLGTAVGHSADTGNVAQAALWESGQLKNLNINSYPKRLFVYGSDVNDAGDVVGVYRDWYQNSGLFVRTNGVVSEIELAGITFEYQDVFLNNSGQVVFLALDVNNNYSRSYYLLDSGTLTKFFEGRNSRISALNDNGQASGLTEDQITHKQLISVWSDGIVTTYGVGSANDINNKGQVVGTTIETLVNNSSRQFAFLLDISTNEMIDLSRILKADDPVRFISGASQINNNGEVLARVYDRVTREYKSYLMTPTESNQAPIANPGNSQTIHTGSVVTLDGSASSDPDANYPLTFQWTLVSTPIDSKPTVNDITSPTPSFMADKDGNYVFDLVVTDSLGLASAPSKVSISTTNTAPIADADADQAVIENGTVVHLDGSQSYDPDGDTISYNWRFVAKPAGSIAELSSPDSASTSFVADVHGTYEIELVSKDPWASSEKDTVVVSFANVKPVANAGNNKSTSEGSTVRLDGTGSSDANNDDLSFAWDIVSKPDGSQATISDSTSSVTSLNTDSPGIYIVNLVVNDGFVDSEPSNVTIVSISNKDALTDILQRAIIEINNLDDQVFLNKNLKKTITNKINALLEAIDKVTFTDTMSKLENDILGKLDGCNDNDQPDKNDWVVDCVSQQQVYPILKSALELLESAM
ncbi:MAG: PKD protein [uncultured bacterium]|nr:MAG: PKD protein [uncultured bacterium]